MRVGVVTTSYPRGPGDPAGSFVGGLTRWLATQGHDVEVVAAGPGARFDGDIPVQRVGLGAGLFYGEGAPERLERSLAARARAPLFFAALLARIAARRWDAVVSHWLVPSGLAAALAPALRGRPHLAVAHSGDVQLLVRRGAGDALALLLGRRARVAFASEALRDRLLASMRRPEALAARSFACPMGIDVASLRAVRGERAAARARLGLAPDARVVAYLGRLVPIKGVEVLVDAIARLPGTTLLIAGDGPERAALAARGGARLLGELRGPARDRLFAAADVLAVPSLTLANGRTEGTPVVALEALAAGVPLVASDVGGLRHAVGEAAWLVPPGDAAALAGALSCALSDRAEAARRAEIGRTIADGFDWSHVGARLWAGLAA